MSRWKAPSASPHEEAMPFRNRNDMAAMRGFPLGSDEAPTPLAVEKLYGEGRGLAAAERALG